MSIAICFTYLFLTWLYGYLRYREGIRAGLLQGTVAGAEALFGFFRKRKVIDQDCGGNIFRVNDLGLRGQTIISNHKPVDIS